MDGPGVIGRSSGSAVRQRWQLWAVILKDHTLQGAAAALCLAGSAKCSVCSDEEVKKIRVVKSPLDRWLCGSGVFGFLDTCLSVARAEAARGSV